MRAGRRVGWQRCEKDVTHFNCTAVIGFPDVYWTRYMPAATDTGFYLRMYAYYETS